MAGSVRRTTSVDLVRPDGFAGPLEISGLGRDLATDAGGGTRVLAEGRADIVVDYLGGRLISAIAAEPAVIGLEVLVGTRAGSGFRRALADALPALAASGSIVHLLLDDVTPGTLISGSSLAREGLVKLAVDSPSAHLPVDICAGWAAGGAMFDAIAETGVPLLGWGPPAPELVPAGDPLAWHQLGALPPGSMRRRRLIDLRPAAEAATELGIEVRYRDSYWERDGTETVVHEYGLVAGVEPHTWTFTGAVATPGPLPAPECPAAAASAGRLAGQSVAGLRSVVREEFTGVSTCTHLNDVFRSLADVSHLWALRSA